MFVGVGVLFLANFIGGAITPLFVKIGTRELSPFIFTFFRFFVASIVFLPFFLKNYERITKKQAATIGFFSLFFGLNATLYAIGLMHTTIIASQILYTLVPVVVGILSYFLNKEKFTVYKIVGGLIAFSGVCLLIFESFQKSQNVSLGTPLGNLIVISAVLCWSFYLVVSKKLTKTFKPTTTSFYSYVITALILSPFFVFEAFSGKLYSIHISTPEIWAISVTGTISAALMFYLMQVGIKKTSAFVASLFFYFAPFFSSLTAIPYLHEKITPLLVIGGTLIIIGVFVASTLEHIRGLKKR